jgi:hypothetical protein
MSAPSSLCSPHTFTYAAGAYAVDEHMQRVTGPRHTAKSLDKIALHHYVLKSREVPLLCLSFSRVIAPACWLLICPGKLLLALHALRKGLRLHIARGFVCNDVFSAVCTGLRSKDEAWRRHGRQEEHGVL